MLKLKRVYNAAMPDDGWRVLVDRLWPRGLSKVRARVDEWAKDIAPSNELRTAFHHGAMPWEEFSANYLAELKENPAVPAFIDAIKQHPQVTLLFSAKDEAHNQAVVLKHFIDAA